MKYKVFSCYCQPCATVGFFVHLMIDKPKVKEKKKRLQIAAHTARKAKVSVVRKNDRFMNFVMCLIKFL